ncbi:RHS repeat-associated core domain-containing protein, partial [Microbulbifer epialgicus]
MNGLEPGLSVGYSGARYRWRSNETLPEDTLGYGWRLAGISEIRRCVKDLPSGSEISFDDNKDSLCLDGEPLVVVSGDYFTKDSSYRTLRESFQYIEMKATDDGEYWFQVKTSDGKIIEYGTSDDSRLRVGNSSVFAWSIKKVTDAFGNSIQYKYHRDEIQGINYPLEIVYGNNGDAKIEFQYGTRTDAPPQPIGPDEIQQEQLVLLHHIRIHLDDTLQREYLFISEEEPAIPEQEHSRRLKQVQLCAYQQNGAGRSCLNPLTLSWSSLEGNSIDSTTGIEKVTDGIGRNTHFKYERLGDIQNMDSNPFGTPAVPQYASEWSEASGNNRGLVSEVHRSNGLAGSCEQMDTDPSDGYHQGCHVTLYDYQGYGLSSTIGWGFLGYYAQYSYDTASGISTYKQLRQDFPHFGKTARLYQYDGVYPAHQELLTQQHFRHQSIPLAIGSNSTLYSYVEQSLKIILEQGQVLGYESKETEIESESYGAFGEVISGTYQSVRIAKNASFSDDQSFWGEVKKANLSNVERSNETTITFYNRTNPWLIGFVNAREVRHYDGDIGDSADRVQKLVYTPYGSTNKTGSVTAYPGDETYELIVDYGYDASGNLVSEITSAPDNADDRLDVKSSSSLASNFVDSRYPQTLSNSLDQKITIGYDPRFGSVTSVTDANGRKVSTKYDSFGRESEHTNADSVVFNTDYDFCGSVSCPVSGSMLVPYRVQTRSTITPTINQYYDLLGRLVQSDTESFNSNNWSRREYEYDAQGRLYIETEPYFPGELPHFTQLTLDNRNRVTAVKRPDGNITDIVYSPISSDRQVKVTLTENILTSNQSVSDTQVSEQYYSLTGNLVKSVDDAMGEMVHTRYTYDGSGLIKTVTLGSGGLDDPATQSSFEFDRAGYRVQLTDPNTGTVESLYNALGQLVWQEDNKGQAIDYDYDSLGRLTKQTDETGIAEWFYDAPNAKGSLESRSYTEGGVEVFLESYSYRGDSKLQSVTTRLVGGSDNKSYEHSYGYDTSGRLNRVTYPNGVEAYYHYNGAGYLQSLSDDLAGSNPLRTFTDINARGQVQEEIYGNGLITNRSYNAHTGRLESINTGSGKIQNNEYRWRSNGALESRLAFSDSNTLQRQEDFTYDGLNRLRHATMVAGGDRVLSTQYDTLGNILSKTSSVSSDTQVTGYQYGDFGNAGPNAVSSVTINGVSQSLYYDANGAIERYDAASGDDKWISWNTRQLPTEIVLGSSQSDSTPTARDRFQYGPDGQRYYRESSWMEGGQLKTEKAFIVGSYEEQIPADASILAIHKTQMAGSVQHIAIIDLTGTSGEYQYLHRDHLGSIEKITDEAGLEILNLAFNPDGSRRQDDWSGDLDQQQLQELFTVQGLTTKRGYTGHEHLDRTGLIHMNGRIYDPTLGRFLSPDPIVQAPTYSQSWNRYSYVFNNPLSLTDPTGFTGEEEKPEFEGDPPPPPPPPDEVVVTGERLPLDRHWIMFLGSESIAGNTYSIRAESADTVLGRIIRELKIEMEAADEELEAPLLTTPILLSQPGHDGPISSGAQKAQGPSFAGFLREEGVNIL